MGAFTSLQRPPQSDHVSMKDIDIDFQPCLQNILDVFNEKDSEGKTVKTKAYNAITEELVAYTSTTHQQSRHAHFVKATNMALEILSPIKIRNSKPAPAFHDENSIMFMVNNPTRMYSVYKSETYCQTPSILLGYRKHIQRIYQKGSDSAQLTDLVAKGPIQPLPWTQALMFAEMDSGSEALTAPARSVVGKDQARPGSDTKESLSTGDNDPCPADAGMGKRPADHASELPASKKRKTNADAHQDGTTPWNIVDEVTPEIRQLADSVAEAMSDSFGRNHVLGFLLTGSTLNVWIFDREGPIQLIGFDFIQDFPHYLLLLYVLQRLSPEDLGILPGFDDFTAENSGDTCSMDLTSCWISEDDCKQRIRFEGASSGEGVPHRYGLHGRSTGARFGTVTISKPEGRLEAKSVALKVSWKHTVRRTEREFIDEARKRIGSSIHATEDPAADPRNFLPEILAERKYTEFDTSIIRDAVLLDPNHHAKSKASRYPYMIVMPRYEPIHTLAKDSGFPLLNAFLALVYCHAVLWSLGIQHGDISDRNLMVDPVTGYPKLCDYDLSHFEGEILPECLFSNTGTWTFMAIELLTPQAMDGYVKRVYRHEVESFLAVLVWILLRYENGQLLRDPPLSEWSNTSYYACGRNRQATYQLLPTKRKPGWLSSDIWKALLLAIVKLEILRQQVHTLQLKTVGAKAIGLTEFLSDSEEEMSPENVGRLEQRLEELNDMRFVRKVLKWHFFRLQTDDPKWAPFLQKVVPDESSSPIRV
ncbi:hypothetical protein CPC08DRAFT_412021 [Agrocybe pediades]|nr:hypothetical protein CPC08DRAFT_412021 [Agrocybe pediades]